MYFGSITFVPVSWVCKKQTSVFDSSTESEIISFEAGLRKDGLLALYLWDIVIEVQRSTNDTVQPKTSWHPGNWRDSPFQNQDPKYQKKEQD